MYIHYIYHIYYVIFISPIVISKKPVNYLLSFIHSCKFMPSMVMLVKITSPSPKPGVFFQNMNPSLHFSHTIL